MVSMNPKKESMLVAIKVKIPSPKNFKILKDHINNKNTVKYLGVCIVMVIP